MNSLSPIFSNTIGPAFLIRDCMHTLTGLKKTQLLLGDAAILLKVKQLASLLETIISAKNGCLCEDCLEIHGI
jgi:hypothetical protein